MNHFLLKPRWMALHLAALGLAILFINLGFWQLRRLEQRQARNELLESRLALETEPLAKLLVNYQTDLPARDERSIGLRPTTVSGEYDAHHEVLYRTTDNYNGQAGYFLLTPLKLAGNEAILVNRGWVPFSFDQPPIIDAAPPEAEVTIYGLVQLERPPPTGTLAGLAPRDPPGELDITAYVDIDRLEAQMPYELLPVFLELSEQSPPHPDALPLPLEEPEFSEGSHLGYAIQWFAFTIIGVIGYGFLLRQITKSRQPH